MDWSQIHKLCVLLLDWLIYNDYSHEAEKLLKYLDEISSGVFVPENETLSRRVENLRSKNSSSRVESSEEPFLNFLVSMGPSPTDGNLFLGEFVPILEALCKSTANKELGEEAVARSSAKEATNLLLAKVKGFSFENSSPLAAPNFQKLIKRLKSRQFRPIKDQKNPDSGDETFASSDSIFQSEESEEFNFSSISPKNLSPGIEPTKRTAVTYNNTQPFDTEDAVDQATSSCGEQLQNSTSSTRRVSPVSRLLTPPGNAKRRKSASPKSPYKPVC
ncbi:Oidioi.mRNA.OKI2018_I69.PAR.g12007.t1.cds [Oikopleura dioica]|uniref:Oidioi.mRNA.OKI2018_I69.PAR.g12007.t1.cds n=1 Tax=Oikopleura dioica TaxID=34765 RepID=A0ABN7S2S0_OIKDI|nr:Oidioi.mRNA.OKI2018_I69.PAR.g12007.t1.cds [Oikopleura dioica]